MAQITRVTSEALQATIRRLLPSQQGFGEDLEATNVITPIIDLTPTAEGSEVRQDLQKALAFGSQTAFRVVNTTTTILNETGFFRIFGTYTAESLGGSSAIGQFDLNDGVDDKLIWQSFTVAGSGNIAVVEFDFIVFLRAGDSVKVTASGSQQVIMGSTRQIATGDGTLVNPSGYPL